MSLLELYKAFCSSGESHEKARALLEQENWFAVNAEFDPKTGFAMPQALSAFLAKIAQSAPDGTTRDRLWRITEHSRVSVERLFHALNESPRREQAVLPIHAVRELDANSFIKLSNRPGRTIREKLAGKPYLQAVRRFQSVNLPENRLLKAFIRRLAELLELRWDCLDQEDPLLPKIQSWLRSEEARAIGNWDNPPPNNTLLSHRDYRSVWDAWRWLQTLDDDVARDLSQLETRDNTMLLWKQCAQMWADGRHLFAEIPLLFDYENFTILPWSSKPPLFLESKQKLHRGLQHRGIAEPACIDLTALRPRYASSDRKSPQSLSATFLWQQWKRDDESVDIELFHVDAAWLHPQAATISAPDLFFAKDKTSENFDRAARAFTSHLRGIFRHDTLIWLVPDLLNDFELEVVRRNLNARFSDAEPLPRSVAAVFAQVDYSKIREGFAVVVVDSAGDKNFATKLLARFDIELKKSLPETGGFYWERCPSVIIDSKDHEAAGVSGCSIITVDANEQWHDPAPPVKPKFVDASFLKSDPRIGNFAFCINLKESPVAGGLFLHALQQRAGDIPLWRNQLPELSIKVKKDGIDQRFHLVSRGTTVKPIRGKPVSIPISEDFILQSGKSFYQFPLYIGDNADDLGFSARLSSTELFPLKSDIVCDLNLTFEYGANKSYRLAFAPRDKSFQPVHATWERTKEVIDNNAPWPEYPVPMTWSDLRHVLKPDSDETSDLLEWVKSAIVQLDRELYIRPKPRTTGVISQKWLIDKNGGHFTFARCNTSEKSVFVHQNNFIHERDYADFTEGKNISFEFQEREGKLSARKVAEASYEEEVSLRDFDEDAVQKLISSVRKRLYFPVIQVWRDGHSISDPQCPKDFSDSMAANIEDFVALLREKALPEPVKNDIRFLLSCMHRDAPAECVQWIIEQVQRADINDPRAVGFALGGVPLQWQKDVLSRLAAHLTGNTLKVFAYAIWRERHFVEKFSFQDLQAVLDSLKNRLITITSAPQKDVRDRSWRRATVEILELLLGLLRARASSDPEIKMLLQPHQNITKELAKQVERVMEIVAQSNVTLISRVQINLQKPHGDRTPDLLFALRLYLTGDDGANAIHISSVSGNDDD